MTDATDRAGRATTRTPSRTAGCRCGTASTSTAPAGARARRRSTCWTCSRTRAATCTWATRRRTGCATCWRATGCGAASTCCTRSAGTPSACPPRTPRSSATSTRRPTPTPTSRRRPSRSAATRSASTGRAGCTRATRSTTAGRSGCSCASASGAWPTASRRAVNWCPNDQTVLANEQVVQGACERCGAQVTKRELTQWFFKVTDYADRLLDDMEQLRGTWPDARAA